ncbi:MAG TPA: hypothetical protein VMI06_12455, partial [Terriglobia bacterium]|nr:hypothetical protein [Terriglobia bacterium]
MNPFDRRQFLQISAAALVAGADAPAREEAEPARIAEHGGALRVSGANYIWEWSPSNDQFQLRDSAGRLITSSILQPTVIVSRPGSMSTRQVALGKVASHTIHKGAITFHYEGVNGHARLGTTWRFEDQDIRVGPVVYETPASEDVVSLHYFADLRGGQPFPGL